jgi:hypothetical protein
MGWLLLGVGIATVILIFPRRRDHDSPDRPSN